MNFKKEKEKKNDDTASNIFHWLPDESKMSS